MRGCETGDGALVGCAFQALRRQCRRSAMRCGELIEGGGGRFFAVELTAEITGDAASRADDPCNAVIEVSLRKGRALSVPAAMRASPSRPSIGNPPAPSSPYTAMVRRAQSAVEASGAIAGGQHYNHTRSPRRRRRDPRRRHDRHRDRQALVLQSGSHLADILGRINDHPNPRLDEFLPWNWISGVHGRAA
jgi:hypothetical protein